MKDFYKIEEDEYKTKYYLNKNDQIHKLTGPAVEYKDGNKDYYIKNNNYISFIKDNNKLILFPGILEFYSEYEEYIKENIKYLIKEFNPKIILSYLFRKEQINELPNWLKDLIIL